MDKGKPDGGSAQESDSANNEHSATMSSEGRCRCGCIPQNVCSLFEMAEKRKQHRLRKQQEDAAAAAMKSQSEPATTD